jgi:hypothetical protein
MRYSLAAIVLFQTCLGLSAGQLPGTWTARDNASNPITSLSDGRPDTACSLQVEAEGATAGVTIDLGSPLVIHRVYWCGDATYKGQDIPFPAIAWAGVTTRVVVLGGASPADLTPMDDECAVAMDSVYASFGKTGADGKALVPGPSAVNAEGDFRFPPRMIRYIRLEARGLPAGASWTLGELEINGFQAWGAKREAVILPDGAAVPLALAARDLSYYLGEMLGRPVPVIATNAATAYGGPLFRIADLKSLAGTADEMAANLKSGRLPSCPVNVEAEGNEVVFKAWPYRNVLVSAWAFLESQGVRWVYPDPHGAVVPTLKKVNLEVLPLRHTPSADRIYANFNIRQYSPVIPWNPENKRWVAFPTESYLYFWRNHWLTSSGGFWFGGGEEVPPSKGPKNEGEAAKLLKEEFRDGGFDGYPHNNCAISSSTLKANPEWMGLKKEGPEDKVGKRSPGVTPCYTSTGLIDFLAAKVNAWAALYGETPKQFNLLPTDAALDCECDSCLALNQPLVKPDIPYCAFPTYYASDAYYHLVTEVAKRCKKASPNASIFALAYANVFAPPRKIAKFPDNVVVEVCAYGHMNLPSDSPRNAKMKAYLEEWATKCKRLETYGYVLLNEDAGTWPMPLPLVTATVDWARLSSSTAISASAVQRCWPTTKPLRSIRSITMPACTAAAIRTGSRRARFPFTCSRKWPRTSARRSAAPAGG